MSDESDEEFKITPKQRAAVHRSVDEWLDEALAIGKECFERGESGVLPTTLRITMSIGDEGATVSIECSAVQEYGPDDEGES